MGSLPSGCIRLETLKARGQSAAAEHMWAKARKIENPEDLKPATDDLSMIARIKKALEEKKKEYLKPLQDYISELRGSFDWILSPILPSFGQPVKK